MSTDQPDTETAAAQAPLAAGIAATVGAVLAQAAAGSAATAAGEDAAEVQVITDAMIRLLIGTPMRSDGRLTVKSLADEAGLKRNKLTHKHTGLKDLFYALVRSQDTRPRIADSLQQQNDELNRKNVKLREERDRLVQEVGQLARVVHVLEVENHQLRQSAGPGGVVRAFPGPRV